MPETLGPLGIFGGTFDPVHLGHLRLAEEAREALGLATVRWIPAGQPPHRNSPKISGAHRLAMVQAAVADNPAFQVDGAEVSSTAPSYTIHTLERLRQEVGPQRPLILLLGADAFAGLATWYRWQDLLKLAQLAILHRPGHPLDEKALAPELNALLKAHRAHDAPVLASAPAGKILSLPMTQLDISATHIRELLASGRSPRYLLPPAVLDYIQQHQLYRNP